MRKLAALHSIIYHSNKFNLTTPNSGSIRDTNHTPHCILCIHTYIYNRTDQCQHMDRRRFEKAHLEYAVHKMKASYSSAFGQVSTIRDIDIGSTLEKQWRV